MLPPNLNEPVAGNGYTFTPLAFTFTDGVNVLTQGNAPCGYACTGPEFEVFQTDADGIPTVWNISVGTGGFIPRYQIQTTNTIVNSDCCVWDVTLQYDSNGNLNEAGNGNVTEISGENGLGAPGTWTVSGSVTYSYKGNPLTSFQGAYSCAAGIGECALSGSFALPALLPPNLNEPITGNGYTFTPLTFTFTDGVNMLTEGNAPCGYACTGPEFEVFQTDANGIPTVWNISVGTGGFIPRYQIQTTNTIVNSDCCIWDTTLDYESNGNLDQAANGNVTEISGENGLGVPGTWSVSSLHPRVISLSPSSGMGLEQTFTAVYSDPLGLSDLSSVIALFNATVNVSSACAVIYVPTTDKMYLYNDAGTGFSRGVTPGSAAQAANKQCTLTGTGSSFTTSGKDLTLKVALTFSGTFVGQKDVFLHATGKTAKSSWVKKGTWTP